MFSIFILILSVLLGLGDANFCSSPDDSTLYVYPNANNCSSFNACINSEEYEFDCLDASIFLPWASGPLCIPGCNEAATTKKAKSKIPNVLPPDPILYPNEPDKTIICPPYGETVAIAEKCGEYIACKDGIGTKTQCPENQEFSPTKFQCVEKKKSDCKKSPPKGSHNKKCLYSKSDEPTYLPASTCAQFLKCANTLAWSVQCARYTEWNNDHKSCEWASDFDCHLTNSK